MTKNEDHPDRSKDPSFDAALHALLAEIESVPVSPRIRELSAKLQHALRAAAERKRNA